MNRSVPITAGNGPMKLFITVGTQLPFDRLIRSIDGWLADHPGIEAFAQLGPTTYRPSNMEFAPFVGAGDCRRRVESASMVIAHAGMGSILTALEVGKPIIVMPRRAVFGEHRNDHQIATARSLLAQGRVIVAFDEAHLIEKLDNLGRLTTASSVSRHASPQLLSTLRTFILGGAAPTDVPSSPPASAEGASPEQPTTQAGDPQHGTNASTPAATLRSLPSRGRTRAILRSLEGSRARQRPERLRRLSGIVLLDGAVRRATFANDVGRSLLELPTNDRQRVLDLWRERVVELSDALDFEHLPCRIVVGRNAQPPQLRPEDESAGFSIERDPADLRGTGGILSDLASDYEDDAVLLVANASQVLTRPLIDEAVALATPEAELSVAASVDGTPVSFSMISCRALKRLPSVGFIDLKEQALPMLSAEHGVAVVRQRRPVGMSIRTAGDYIAALRHLHGAESTHRNVNAFGERWGSTFSVVEEGGSVAPGAMLHNSVVLAGGRVEAGALVARSIVCGGSRVEAGARIVDQLVKSGASRALAGRAR